MNRRRTLLGAWYVLRANQKWAPYPDNDPDAARELMRRFYALVVRDGDLELDPVRASELEVEWWRLHREHQHDPAVEAASLVQALVDLYSYVYSPTREAMRPAAAARVEAMDLSDRWVAAGCRPTTRSWPPSAGRSWRRTPRSARSLTSAGVTMRRASRRCTGFRRGPCQADLPSPREAG